MIPDGIDQLTPAWFSEVLDAHVTAVDVLDAHSGTTGRARVRIKTQADLPETLFVKLQPATAEHYRILVGIRDSGLGIRD